MMTYASLLGLVASHSARDAVELALDAITSALDVRLRVGSLDLSLALGVLLDEFNEALETKRVGAMGL